MHALLADLLPWVLAFYLLEGVVQPRRGHLWLCGAPRLRPRRAGLTWLGPWPWVEAVALFDLPWLRAGRRIWVLDPRRRTEPALIEAADLTPVALDGLAPDRTAREVSAGGGLLLAAPTPAAAARLREELAAAAAGDEERGVDGDLAAARALRARLRGCGRWLRALGTALAALLAVAGPLVAWSPLGASLPAGALLGACGLLLLALAAVGVAYLRRAGEGWRTSLAGGAELLLPWAGMHPLLHLPRAIYRRLDPLAVSAALLPPEELQALAARELVRARLSRARTPDELAPAWEARARHLAALLAATGSSVEAALAPPPAAPGVAAFCPLCRTGYRAGFTTCGDCGAALEPLRAAQQDS